MTEADRKKLTTQQTNLMFERKIWEDLQAKYSTDSAFYKLCERYMCELDDKADYIRRQLETDGIKNGTQSNL